MRRMHRRNRVSGAFDYPPHPVIHRTRVYPHMLWTDTPDVDNHAAFDHIARFGLRGSQSHTHTCAIDIYASITKG